MGYELGIIGAGNMAEAIARGVLTGGLYRADQLIAATLCTLAAALFFFAFHDRRTTTPEAGEPAK